MNKVKIFILVIVLLVVGTLATAITRKDSLSTGPGIYDNFAQCLKDSGTIFYGAFWCPHCQAQKKLFGSSQKLLPYVECSTLDGKAMTEECRAKGIEGYPTWEFPDGSRLSGEVALSVLAEKSACPLRPSFSEASELPL
ncbi:hypothetical protein A2914_00340 [Candidatus Nomurabacteria bacterium RIFCSPLOWO2_01_FULL_41_21]|uniref:Thioredoxin domain-containing protein n=2 Tax=Candidatus Nomuraibacteriota TaxID=1752729 RepID=A0A1F6V385_9BACT|nr:MAG: hypothetical protein A2733_02745 [Candidatus Nomurabacteria bacterium RIFCSPHIGHO2_01_FULL_40_20]OGI88802.1 MAG: hypothetical protein A2914_00340 [Candidatus Nomurabacteria bacterium RIFCSPLOWO2_01_FULL_41_21]